MREVQLDMFPTDARLVRIDVDRRMRRYYRLTIQPELFGGCTLVREWGRIGQGGQLRFDHHPDPGRAIDALDRLARDKRRRGYVLHV